MVTLVSSPTYYFTKLNAACCWKSCANIEVELIGQHHSNRIGAILNWNYWWKLRLKTVDLLRERILQRSKDGSRRRDIHHWVEWSTPDSDWLFFISFGDEIVCFLQRYQPTRRSVSVYRLLQSRPAVLSEGSAAASSEALLQDESDNTLLRHRRQSLTATGHTTEVVTLVCFVKCII